jgi:hypothetical protein
MTNRANPLATQACLALRCIYAMSLQSRHRKMLRNTNHSIARLFHILRHDDAIARFKRILSINPAHEQAIDMLVYVLAKLRRWEELQELLLHYSYQRNISLSIQLQHKLILTLSGLKPLRVSTGCSNTKTAK